MEILNFQQRGKFLAMQGKGRNGAGQNREDGEMDSAVTKKS